MPLRLAEITSAGHLAPPAGQVGRVGPVGSVVHGGEVD
jgi:hypothetical protein